MWWHHLIDRVGLPVHLPLYAALNIGVTLKSGLGVVQGH